MNKKLKEIIENMSKDDLINSFITVYEDSIKKDLEIERLNNKVDELMTLYTTEREVKEDYKSIIKEVREYIENTPKIVKSIHFNQKKVKDDLPAIIVFLENIFKDDIRNILDKGE